MYDLTNDNFFTNVTQQMELLDDSEYLRGGSPNNTSFNVAWNSDGGLDILPSNSLPWEYAPSKESSVVGRKYFMWDFNIAEYISGKTKFTESRLSSSVANNMTKECACNEYIFPWSFDENKCDKCTSLADITDNYLVYLNKLNSSLNIVSEHIEDWTYISRRYLFGGNIIEEIEPEDNTHIDDIIVVPPWINSAADIRIYKDEVRDLRNLYTIIRVPNNLTVDGIRLGASSTARFSSALPIDMSDMWVESNVTSWTSVQTTPSVISLNTSMT